MKDALSFTVTALQAEGETIIHKGHFNTEGQTFNAGDRVTLKVNAAKRRLHARIHSAGHLLDVAFHSLGFTNGGTKGYHFPDGPNVSVSTSCRWSLLGK